MIPLVKPYLGKNASKYVNDCLTTGWISSQGKYVRIFEEKFAQYIGTRYAIATSNGTTALHLALVGVGVGKGNVVSVPNMTFAATINAVLYTGATPVVVGTNMDTWCIDWRYVRSKIVVPVHLYGRPAPVLSGYIVVEDCAEALGAKIGGQRVGSIGNCGAFSFFGNKILTTGEGGMVTTNDRTAYQDMLLLRDHGKDIGYHHSVVGFNYRMTNLQAAIGLAQLEEIDRILEKRDKISQWYSSALGLPKPPGVCWLYTIFVNNRDAVMKALKDKGIESRPVFEPLSTMDIYKPYSLKSYPNTERFSRRGLSLPTYYSMKQSEVKLICEVVNANRID